MSSRGYLVDLIESIGEKVCLTSHIEEKMRVSEDENEKIQLGELLALVLKTRREEMNLLLEMSDNPDPTYWCQFKHSVGSFMRDVELYEATKSESCFELMKMSADALAMSTSLFLGMEFETCARCLADKFLVQQVQKERSGILKTNKEMNENDN